MTLIDQVRGEMMQALKEKNSEKKEALSSLLAALKAKAIDKRSELTQEEELAVVMREIKQLRESIDTAPSSGYEDMIAKCQKNMEFFSVYIPAQMDRSEIKSVIDNLLSTLSITSPTAKDKGIIMKNLMPLTKGKADGKLVNEIVAEYFCD